MVTTGLCSSEYFLESSLVLVVGIVVVVGEFGVFGPRTVNKGCRFAISEPSRPT